MRIVAVLAVLGTAAVGATLRAALGDRLNGSTPGGLDLPWGTLTANVVASGLLGVLAANDHEGAVWATALSVGGFGALSTWSTFAIEALEEWRRRRSIAVGYAALTVVAAVGAAWLGLRVGR